ncbi:MCE family protein [Nocardioides cavernaquae]|uniref:MCE family protein n=1 Tax=Nocardioides cavernaquae TaxID=2321396 RepID=A0A3A5H8K4_9ACTN|nr:MCE family protein [Nocardioides cavernaquae]RJS46351.1 MCE family protein [Nocardioides cavernaquae]
MNGNLRGLVVAVLGALLLTSCSFDVYKLPLPGGADTGDDPMTLKVQFADVLDLVPQSTVKVADVSVGKVTDIDLRGYAAEVTVEIHGDVDLPANTVATIRQTSLLGEKFVSLAPPETGASSEPLADNDVIPINPKGHNPEVEEVLGALSLLLNGGGVAQLKTISSEISLALEGNEGAAKSVLRQLAELMGTLEEGKADIVHAIEAVNRLAIAANKQMPAIDSALEELPSALASLDRQRDDLVKMLAALENLSDVGVRVISASKESTISAFRDLHPVLKSLADAGKDLPNSLQILFTYPFPDSIFGRDPQAARNLHMGDFVNLSIQMDLDVRDLIENPAGLPVPECQQLQGLGEICGAVLRSLQNCLQQQSASACLALPGAITTELCKLAPLPGVCPAAGGTSGGTTGGTTNPLQDVIDQLGLPGLGRAATGTVPSKPTYRDLMRSYDPDLVALLVPGVTR